MIDSQQAAQVLFNHRLATQEQILACWPYISTEKDVGMILVERGIITHQTYREVAPFLEAQTRPAEPAVSAQATQTTQATPAADVPDEIAFEPATPALSAFVP